MIFIVGSTKFVYFVLLLFLLLLYFHEQKKLLDLLMGLLKLEQSLSLLQVLNPIAFFLFPIHSMFSIFPYSFNGNLSNVVIVSIFILQNTILYYIIFCRILNVTVLAYVLLCKSVHLHSFLFLHFLLFAL